MSSSPGNNPAIDNLDPHPAIHDLDPDHVIHDLDPRSPDSERQTTLADKVFDWLTEQLVVGNLRPGQWVSENEVAALLGVSRSPVRDAFRQLAREGILEARRRRGTIVAELNAVDVDNLYKARQLVDAEMARLAVEQMTEEDVERLAEVVDFTRQAIADGSTPGSRSGVFEATRQLWQFLMDRCPNRTICELVALLWRRSIRMRSIGLALPAGRQELYEFFEQFLAAARAKDADAAGQAMADQQDNARRRLLAEAFIDLGESQLVARRAEIGEAIAEVTGDGSPGRRP